MDTKQLLTGKPREGFYPVVQDTVTVIELNEAVMSLTSESSSEDIIAAFDDIDSFNTLVEQVRNIENIVNGILVNNDSATGKLVASIYADKNENNIRLEYVYEDKFINLSIANSNDVLSCVRTESNIGGDKTNVLILSLENDLANGQKDSPVNAEVSTTLKDAISTGKACVIKSANSDILANLQQTGDNVTIVMEQISRISQTFVAVNTTITVNTATNIISDYQTGAIVLETEGDGSKFLSNDGNYKEINDIYYIDAAPTTSTGLEGVKTALANNKLPVFKHLYEGNPAYELSPAICSFSSDGRLVSYMILDTDKATIINISQTDELTLEQISFKQIEKINVNSFVGSTIPVENYNKLQVQNGTKVILIDDPDEGWYSIPAVVRGLTTIIIEYIYKEQYNKITIDSSYNVTKETKDLGADLSNYLAKDNTTSYTPTSDYQPATKKYVDDSNIKLITTYPTLDRINIVNIQGNSLYLDLRLNCKIILTKSNSMVAIIQVEDVITNKCYATTSAYLYNNTGISASTDFSLNFDYEYKSSADYSVKANIEINATLKHETANDIITIPNEDIITTCTIKEMILSESQYSSLGTTPNTDGVLYFITPD